MKRLTLSGILPVLALSLSSVAQAGGGGFGGAVYLGGSIGASHSGAKTTHLTHPDACKHAGSNCQSDHRDRAWQVHGGYAFAPNLALEGGYVNLGKTADVRSKGLGGNLHGKQKTKAASLSLVGKAPIGPLSGYGKVGAYHWASDVTVDGPSSKNKATHKGTGATVGLGVELPLSGDFAVRAGWDRYFNAGKQGALLSKTGASSLKTDVDVYSVGVVVNF